VVGTSAGAAIAIDLAVRRPEFVRVAIAHEFPWRSTRHISSVSQVKALAKIGLLLLAGRHGDTAEALLHSPTPTVTVDPHGMPFPRSGGGLEGKRSGSPGRLPQLHRHLSIRRRSRDR
jgi:hypothetical protein